MLRHTLFRRQGGLTHYFASTAQGSGFPRSTSTRCSSTASNSTIPPFHLAVPVHNLKKAQDFYGKKLGFQEGRSSKSWQDYNCFGHQLVCHEVSPDYKAVDHHNPVDMDDVPVPHFGIALTVDEFKAFSARLQNQGIQFILEPHKRFEGRPGEQWTMFFKDPSGNNLEFKAMTNPDNLFAKYVEN